MWSGVQTSFILVIIRCLRVGRANRRAGRPDLRDFWCNAPLLRASYSYVSACAFIIIFNSFLNFCRFSFACLMLAFFAFDENDFLIGSLAIRIYATQTRLVMSSSLFLVDFAALAYDGTHELLNFIVAKDYQASVRPNMYTCASIDTFKRIQKLLNAKGRNNVPRIYVREGNALMLVLFKVEFLHAVDCCCSSVWMKNFEVNSTVEMFKVSNCKVLRNNRLKLWRWKVYEKLIFERLAINHWFHLIGLHYLYLKQSISLVKFKGASWWGIDREDVAPL